MKYIRTKDGIFEVVEEHKDEGFFNIKINHLPNKLSLYYTEENYIYTPADTIEELCDYAVAVIDTRETPILECVGYGSYTSEIDDFKELFEDYGEYIKTNRCQLYGAIWTDKGLIYVAKMNEKGELELL